MVKKLFYQYEIHIFTKREGLQSEESKSLSSMLDRCLDTKGGIEVDVAGVVALSGEDECRQPSTIISTTTTHTLPAKRKGGGRTGKKTLYQSKQPTC